MVCPDMLVTMSPGLVALPPGIFSVVGIIPTTFMGSFISAIAVMVPNTLAAPHISYFISSIFAAGFKEMPPVSKVTPLPTNTIGFSFLLKPQYSSVISLAGSLLPCATDSSEPMPSFFISFCSKIVALSLKLLAIFTASFAR